MALLLAAGATLLLASNAPAYGAPTMTITAEVPTSTVEPTQTVVPTPTVDPSRSAWMKRYWGRRVHRVKTTQRVVALTFDDGPNSRTGTAVRILDSYGAKGTFFATGYQSKKPKMAAMNRYVLAQGHELANHTMNHDKLDKSYALSIKAIDRLEKLLIAQTGQGTTWVRAMGGAVDSQGLKATRKTGHLYAQWSLSIADSVRRYTPPNALYHNVVDHIRPGSVVLMHVTHPETLKALPRICRELKRRGYRMVTLSEMAAMGNPYP